MLGGTHVGGSDWASSHHRGQRDDGSECERELHRYEEKNFGAGLQRVFVAENWQLTAHLIY